MKQQEKAEETTQSIISKTRFAHTGAQYQRKTKESLKSMEEYW